MQVNVLGAERRRRWSYDEKVRLVEETLQPGETVCGVARRHGVAHSLLFTWRRQARQGRLGGDTEPALVPVEIAPVAAPISRISRLPSTRSRAVAWSKPGTNGKPQAANTLVPSGRWWK